MMMCIRVDSGKTREGENDEPLAYREEKRVVQKILYFLLGHKSMVSTALTRAPHKGGIKHLSHLFQPEFTGAYRECQELGFTTMLEAITMPHKMAFVKGKTWTDLPSYMEKLYANRRCFTQVPGVALTRSLLVEVMSNKKPDIHNMAVALETNLTRAVENWASKKVDGVKGLGVPVHFYQDEEDKFNTQDVFGPAMAILVVALVSATVSNDVWIKAVKEIAHRIGKNVFELSTSDILKNKFEIFDRLNNLTGRTGYHFCVDEFSRSANKTFSDLALGIVNSGTKSNEVNKSRSVDCDATASDTPCQETDPLDSVSEETVQAIINRHYGKKGDDRNTKSKPSFQRRDSKTPRFDKSKQREPRNKQKDKFPSVTKVNRDASRNGSAKRRARAAKLEEYAESINQQLVELRAMTLESSEEDIVDDNDPDEGDKTEGKSPDLGV